MNKTDLNKTDLNRTDMNQTESPAVVCRTVESPIGPLTLAGHGDTLTHLRMDDQTHPPTGQEAWTCDDGAFDEVVEQLEAYFAGERLAFDVTLVLDGTEFQRARLGRVVGDPVRGDAVLRRDRGADRPARTRHVPSAWPTGATPWPSSCRATGSSAPPVR